MTCRLTKTLCADNNGLSLNAAVYIGFRFVQGR
jgi:hypothetical protein